MTQKKRTHSLFTYIYAKTRSPQYTRSPTAPAREENADRSVLLNNREYHDINELSRGHSCTTRHTKHRTNRIPNYDDLLSAHFCIEHTHQDTHASHIA